MRRMRKSLFLTSIGIVFFGVALLVAGLICWINEAKAIPVNKSYISAFEIKNTIDGSAPFDADNNPGNDQNSSNGITASVVLSTTWHITCRILQS